MALGTLLQRWIEVLARLYFTCLEAWGGQRAVIVSSKGDGFVMRKMPARPDIRSVQPHDPGQGRSDRAAQGTAEGPVISELKPGRPLSAAWQGAADTFKSAGRAGGPTLTWGHGIGLDHWEPPQISGPGTPAGDMVASEVSLLAAIATGVGTDSQRPFALVIVSGLFTRLLISVFLMPALYALVARPADRLEV